MTTTVNTRKNRLPPDLTEEDVAPYSLGLKHLLDSGRLRPHPAGNRVLLCAILRSDAATIETPDNLDMGQAQVHKVVDVGPEVKTLRVGMHVVHISTAGSEFDDNKSNRYTLVEEQDVMATWTIDEIAPVIPPSSDP